MSKDTFQRVVRFIEDRLWAPKAGFTEETTLREDVGITGAEAAEFMQDFGDEFGVDLSDFEFDRYFEREANALLLPFTIVQALFRSSRGGKTQNSMVPVRVKDLVKSAEAGRWIPPEVARTS